MTQNNCDIPSLLNEHIELGIKRAQKNYELGEAKAKRDLIKAQLWLEYRQNNTLIETENLVATDEKLILAEHEARKAELAYDLENYKYQNVFRRLLAFNSSVLAKTESEI